MKTLRLPIHDEIDRFVGHYIGVMDMDAVRLAYLAAQVPENGLIVEIGSFWGRSSCFLASAAKPGVKIICIDRWDKPVDFKKFNENITHFGFDKIITPVHAKSLDVVRDFRDPIDLLYIDADHHYDAIKADYEAWMPLVRSGGTIAFHDYCGKAWPDVKRYIDNVVQEELQISGIYQLIWSGVKP